MLSNGGRLTRSRIRIFSRRRFLCLVILLALPLLLGAKAKKSKDPILYQDGFLQVVSPDKVSKATCKEAADMVKEAWKFDLSMMHWSRTKEMNRPLTLRLHSAERMKAKTGVRASSSFNGNVFTMNASMIGTDGALGTCAHELGHIQAFRALGKRVKSVPLYFIEGHGLILNRLYSDHHRLTSPKDWTKNIRTVMSMSPEEARTILTDNSYSNNEKDPKKTFKMECMGVYFVEFMRTRHNGHGIPDMVPKMGRVFELVGQGKSYGQAFKQVYGVFASQVAAEIVDLFKRTEGNPTERYRGTRFEATAQIVAEKS
jgi:hypothetical protein